MDVYDDDDIRRYGVEVTFFCLFFSSSSSSSSELNLESFPHDTADWMGCLDGGDSDGSLHCYVTADVRLTVVITSPQMEGMNGRESDFIFSLSLLLSPSVRLPL